MNKTIAVGTCFDFEKESNFVKDNAINEKLHYDYIEIDLKNALVGSVIVGFILNIISYCKRKNIKIEVIPPENSLMAEQMDASRILNK